MLLWDMILKMIKLRNNTGKKELWSEILEVYMNQNNTNVGVTIPDLVGGYYEYSCLIDLETSGCIKQILQEIINSNLPEVVIIQYCSNLKQYVLTLAKNGFRYRNIKGRIFFHNCTHDIRFEFPDEIDELAEVLYSFYRSPIINKQFSCNRETGEWCKFSDKELKELQLSFDRMK